MPKFTHSLNFGGFRSASLTSVIQPHPVIEDQWGTTSFQPPAHWHSQNLVPQTFISSPHEFVLQVKENCSVGDSFVPCHPFPTFLPFHCQYKTSLFYNKEPGTGQGDEWWDKHRSAKWCSCRSVVYAHFHENSSLAGAQVAMAGPTLAYPCTCTWGWRSLKGPRGAWTMANCPLLWQEVGHTSSGLSFEKAACKGILGLGHHQPLSGCFTCGGGGR